MKILFFGDSITDCGRDRNNPTVGNGRFGSGYVMQAAGRLFEKDPEKYEVINTGISGNRIVDLYARAKVDLWNYEPDVISILIGINDIWHELSYNNGVELDRFERIYDMLLEDTKKVLPNARIVLCEPFVLEGGSTCAIEEMPDRYERFKQIYGYAKEIKKLADEYGLYFLPLQEKFSEGESRIGSKFYAPDGVHPNVGGSALIASEWVKLFRESIEK